MRCPNCKQETQHEGNPYRPFCSERCKLIDLDNWLEGRYRITGAGDFQESPRPEDANHGGDENGG